jgi:hypothetical protein
MIDAQLRAPSEHESINVRFAVLANSKSVGGARPSYELKLKGATISAGGERLSGILAASW